MGSSVSPLFTSTYSYNWSFTKEEIDETAENQALWGPVITFGPYGPWILSFYPHGYLSSTPAKFAVILNAVHKKPSYVPSCLAQTQLSLTNEDGKQSITTKLSKSNHQISKLNPCVGCGWYQKGFNERFPETQNWQKINFTIVCSFTSIEINLVDDRNWLTYTFLVSNGVSRASDFFFDLDLTTQKLDSVNTDCTVAYYVKKWFSKKPNKVEVPMHKSKLVQQSAVFAKHFSENPDVPLDFSDFSDKIVKDMIIFCYKGELDSYTEEHIAFAFKFKMQNLLLKADEFLSMKAKHSNIKKMMDLTERYGLPELTKKCFYIIEVSSHKKKESFMERLLTLLKRIRNYIGEMFCINKKV